MHPMNAQPAADLLACSIPDACRRLGIGRTTLYELVKAGELHLIRFGARSLVPESELRALVASRLSAACTAA